jgi:hypothetical protein
LKDKGAILDVFVHSFFILPPGGRLVADKSFFLAPIARRVWPSSIRGVALRISGLEFSLKAEEWDLHEPPVLGSESIFLLAF